MPWRQCNHAVTIDANQAMYKFSHSYLPQSKISSSVTKHISSDIFKVNFKYNFRMGSNFVKELLLSTNK